MLPNTIYKSKHNGILTAGMSSLQDNAAWIKRANESMEVRYYPELEVFYNSASDEGKVASKASAKVTVALVTAFNFNGLSPADNGGSAITSYMVYVYQGGVLQGGLSTSGTSSPVIVTGLTNGTAYTFTVIAANAAGNSSQSAASNAIYTM